MPSIEFDSLSDQMEIARRLEERIDDALKDEVPIKWNYKQPKDS